jgi:hypothetical protein
MVNKKRRNLKSYTYEEPAEEYYHKSEYKLKVADSQIALAGKGVYTEQYITSNVKIDGYYGYKTSYLSAGAYFVELPAISDYKGIDAQGFPRCYMAMINDSHGSIFSNNCEIRLVGDEVEIWSIRDIDAGEELFMSYGSEYWT